MLIQVNLEILEITNFNLGILDFRSSQYLTGYVSVEVCASSIREEADCI